MSTVLITGVSRGIGKAAAKAFAKEGWDLLLVARNQSSINTLLEELKEIGCNRIFYELIDLANPSQIAPGIKSLLTHGLLPSVVINNAGVAWTGDLLSMPLHDWEWTMQLNLTSVFQICSEVVPVMRGQGGLVINVSSHASRNAFPQWGAYCVSKAALASFTKCLAEEERVNGVRAITLTLGSVNSSLWDTDTVRSKFDRNAMLSEDQVVFELLHLAKQPTNQVIEDMTLMPARGTF